MLFFFISYKVLDSLLLLFIILFVFFLLYGANTVYALFSFMGVIFCMFLLLLRMHLEFFALLYLLVYVGVVLVFFIFIIMLLNLRFERVWEFDSNSTFAIFAFCNLNFIFHFFLLRDFNNLQERADNILYTCKDGIIERPFGWYEWFFLPEDLARLFDHRLIGFYMFEKYGFLSFLIAFILFFVMIGVVNMITVMQQHMKIRERAELQSRIRSATSPFRSSILGRDTIISSRKSDDDAQVGVIGVATSQI